MQDLSPLMQRLSYTFHRPDLLVQALTHPSMGHHHNQRLEFLGDAVLQLIISDMLYATHPSDQEGSLTHQRQLLVCETALSEVASKLGLGQYLSMDHGEELSGGREKSSVLCDTMEAVLAAVYLDGGMNEATRIVRRFWPRPEDVKMPMQDSKNVLQERLQAQGGDPPAYVKRVAAFVDRKLSETAAVTNLPSGQAAVLTCFNLAEDLLKAQDENMLLRRQMEQLARTNKAIRE